MLALCVLLSLGLYRLFRWAPQDVEEVPTFATVCKECMGSWPGGTKRTEKEKMIIYTIRKTRLIRDTYFATLPEALAAHDPLSGDKVIELQVDSSIMTEKGLCSLLNNCAVPSDFIIESQDVTPHPPDPTQPKSMFDALNQLFPR